MLKLPYKVAIQNKSLLAQYIQLLKGCWYFAGERRWHMYVFYSSFLIANVLYMFQPWVIGKLINTLQTGGDNVMEEAAWLLGTYVGLSLIFWIFHGPARVLELCTAFHVKRAYTDYCYDIITKLPLRWHRDHHTGNTVNRVNKTVAGLNDFSGSQYAYFENIIRFSAAFVFLGFVNIYVALAAFIFSVLIIILLSGFDKIMIKKTHAVNEKEHVFSSTLLDFMSNIDNVILFTLKSYSRSKISTALQKLYAPLKTLIITGEIKWFSLMILMSISHVAILLGYIGYHLHYDIPLMLGTVVTIFQYMLKLDWTLFSIAFLYQRLVKAGTDYGAIENIMTDCEETSIDETDADELHVKKGAISFENVHFTHDRGAQVFDGMHLEIPANQKLGVIGHSGAGKTTLVQLLLRFYDTKGPSIQIDGQDITNVTTESLRKNISIIPQDTTLFETSLLENIRYGRIGATDEEVYAAAEKAHCDEFIKNMPDGYDTEVGERGIKLSGGQRQRVSIARAVLKDAPILILDEATSALDTQSEHYIQESLEGIMKGKTVIAIAHRLSTLKNMDRIVVLEEGVIIEDGTHKGLLAKDGSYAKQWNMQSGGFV